MLYESSIEINREARREYYTRTKAAYFVRKVKRRSATLKATPSWYTEFDDFVAAEAKHLADLRFTTTGTKWELDHIIPIQGKEVCGLHWHLNWQLITQNENRSKANKLLSQYAYYHNKPKTISVGPRCPETA